MAASLASTRTAGKCAPGCGKLSAVAAPSAQLAKRVVVRPLRAVAVVEAPTETATKVVQPSPINPHEMALARVKYLLQLEKEQLAQRPQVKITLRQKVGLGEYWKLAGTAVELGRWTPEVGPAMTWSNGDVWTFQGPIKPGKYTYKAVLRNAEGAYIYEDGPDHILEIPEGSGPEDLYEFVIDSVKFPSRG